MARLLRYSNLKRIFDIFISIFLIIIFSGLLVLISLVVIITLGTPVLFKQQRPGLNGKLFTMFKFRTMTNKVDSNGQLLDDNQRITKVGYFLRRFSLDELPQLLNILKGDISLVGPRPLLVEYLELYTPEQARRHKVKPGITGWAQVNGRNLLSWEERFEMDVWYVGHQSFWLDLKILLITASYVVTGKGISQQGNVTMTKFKGSKIE